MKKYLSIGTLACVLTAATITQADVILQDSFNYPDGSLATANPVWQVHSAGTGGALNVANNAALIAGSAGGTADINATLTNSPYSSTGPAAAAT